MSVLDRIQPQPLPQKQALIDRGVSIGAIANFTGLSYTYVINLMGGHQRASAEFIQQLDDLIAEIDAERAAAADASNPEAEASACA